MLICFLITIVRVGGGFLSIDEFIEQYGPVETDKIIRTGISINMD